MNTIKISNMKLGCKLLYQTLKSPVFNRYIHVTPHRFLPILGLRCVINHTHKLFSLSYQNWPKNRIFSITCCSGDNRYKNGRREFSTLETSVNDVEGGEKVESEAEKEAWRLLKEAVVTYCGNPVGTMAANDPNDKMPLNYDQVFIRDFVPSALAFLLKGEGEIVRNFLLHTLQLQVICWILNGVM